MNLLTSETEGLDGCYRQTGDDNALSQHLDLAKQKHICIHKTEE